MATEYTPSGKPIAEAANGIHALEPLAATIAAFVGRTGTGPVDIPTLVTSFADFEGIYGGLQPDCPLTYAVRQFFANEGSRALIARVVRGAGETAPLTDADLSDPALEAAHRGLWLLDQAESFNLLCIPPLAPGVDVGKATWNAAIAYARRRHAFVLVDPPAAWTSVADAVSGLDAIARRDANAAIHFPRIEATDPLDGDAIRAFAPCGAIAGAYARIDASRGLWKAPAGSGAVLQGTTGVTVAIDGEGADALGHAGINALRQLPSESPLIWGARTLAGADTGGSEWKYVPVRRLALAIEDRIERGTHWVAFEPNDDALWAQLVWQVDAFLQSLWRQGAFQGAKPKSAYFVKCDATTMTPADIAAGRVVLVIGFAALKPAEFSILRFTLRTAVAR